MSQLQIEFEHEMEIHWCNEQGEPDIDYVNWLEAKVEKFTSTNTGSPKLPLQNEIGNALRDMRAGQGSFVTDLEWGVLTFVYDFIQRQLRAGA